MSELRWFVAHTRPRREKKLIEFKQGSGWAWDLPEIKKMQITENVVELMVDKLNKLSNKNG